MYRSYQTPKIIHMKPVHKRPKTIRKTLTEPIKSERVPRPPLDLVFPK